MLLAPFKSCRGHNLARERRHEQRVDVSGGTDRSCSNFTLFNSHYFSLHDSFMRAGLSQTVTHHLQALQWNTIQ